MNMSWVELEHYLAFLSEKVKLESKDLSDDLLDASWRLGEINDPGRDDVLNVIPFERALVSLKRMLNTKANQLNEPEKIKLKCTVNDLESMVAR